MRRRLSSSCCKVGGESTALCQQHQKIRTIQLIPTYGTMLMATLMSKRHGIHRLVDRWRSRSMWRWIYNADDLSHTPRPAATSSLRLKWNKINEPQCLTNIVYSGGNAQEVISTATRLWLRRCLLCCLLSCMLKLLENHENKTWQKSHEAQRKRRESESVPIMIRTRKERDEKMKS